MSCEARMVRALIDLEGVARVKARYQEKRVALTYNPCTVTSDRIASALSETGYAAVSVVKVRDELIK